MEHLGRLSSDHCPLLLHTEPLDHGHSTLFYEGLRSFGYTTKAPGTLWLMLGCLPPINRALLFLNSLSVSTTLEEPSQSGIRKK